MSSQDKPSIIYSQSDRISQFFITIMMVIITIITLYPLILIVMNSISDPIAVMHGEILLFPKGISLESYKKVFETKTILTGYRNTIFYALAGTTLNITLTVMAAYPLSRKRLYGRKALTLFCTFTMFFSGGIIPTYIVVKQTGLLDTFGGMIIPTAVSMWNVIIMRSFFENLPEEIFEAAAMDGAGHIKTLVSIVLPLSKASLAVIILFYAVTHWNAYFNGLMYLSTEAKYPLQLVLRNILLQNQLQDTGSDIISMKSQMLGESMKYSAIVVSSLPLIIVYPFLQKYFVQGVMVGAVKG